MTIVGESSGVREEVFTDIPVATEQLVGYTPVAPVVPLSESEPEGDYLMDLVEPVMGGVLRSGSQDSDGESEEDPAEIEIGGAAEEVPEEGSPVFHTFQDDLLGDYADRIIEQEQTIEQKDARIAHLEEQNAVHQELEDQYRSEAYLLQFEVIELKAQIQQLEGAAPQSAPAVQQLMLHNGQLRQAIEHFQAKEVEQQTVLQAVRAERDWEQADRARVHELWVRAATRVSVLEREARDRSAEIDTLEYALNTTFHRLRDRVRRYPREEGSSRRTISRRVVDRMARQAFRRVVRRSRR